MFLVGPSQRTVGAAEVRIRAEGNIVIERSHGRGWLGASLEDVTSENMSRLGLQKEQGVILKEIQKDSPADRAGLQPNDVVLT